MTDQEQTVSEAVTEPQEAATPDEASEAQPEPVAVSVDAQEAPDALSAAVEQPSAQPDPDPLPVSSAPPSPGPAQVEPPTHEPPAAEVPTPEKHHHFKHGVLAGSSDAQHSLHSAHRKLKEAQ